MEKFGEWITRHRVLAHLLLPAAGSLLLMGLYFSGNATAQAVVAPTIEGLARFSWREFGAVEMLQNLLLLGVIAYLARITAQSRFPWPGIVPSLVLAAFVFVLLEEIDYGIHFYEYFSGEPVEVAAGEWNRNLHNRMTEGGKQWGNYIKDAAKAVLLIGFVIAPLLFRNSGNRTVRLLTPSPWIVATVILMALLSRLAHIMDNAGLSYIDGSPGNLEYNISEFRELNMYYIALIYVAELALRLTRARNSPTG